MEPGDVQARMMAAVDEALAPVQRLAATNQPMNTASLNFIAACVRSALAVMVYGPPEAVVQPEPEPEAPAADVNDPQPDPQMIEEPADPQQGVDPFVPAAPPEQVAESAAVDAPQPEAEVLSTSDD
jgi:hypothetical protein